MGNDLQAAAVLVHGNHRGGEAAPKSDADAEQVAVLVSDTRSYACGLSRGASAAQTVEQQADSAGAPAHQPSDTDVAALEVGSTQAPAPAPAGGACAAQRRSVALEGFLGSLAAGDWDGAGLQELCNAQSQLAAAMQRLSGAIASRGMAAAAHQKL